jgi:hypothetical protein
MGQLADFEILFSYRCRPLQGMQMTVHFFFLCFVSCLVVTLCVWFAWREYIDQGNWNHRHG